MDSDKFIMAITLDKCVRLHHLKDSNVSYELMEEESEFQAA